MSRLAGSMELTVNLHLWLVLALILAALVAFAAERWRTELTALGVLVGLMAIFYVVPFETASGPIRMADLLVGFGNPAVISVMALLVVGQAMVLTGAIQVSSRPLVEAAARRPTRTVALTIGCVIFASAFLNNTPVVVIFIPVMRAIADQIGISTGRVMLPLSYAAILGGMLTLVGSSSNLLVAAELQRLEAGNIEFFDLTLPGSALVLAGATYIGIWMWRRGGSERDAARDVTAGTGRQFIAELELATSSPLVGATSAGGLFPALRNVTLRGIQRDGRLLVPPYDGVTLEVGDVLIVAATRRVLSDLLVNLPGHVTVAVEPSDEPTRSTTGPEMALAEVMVRPASRLVGLTLELTNFARRNNVTVVGIQRRARMLRARMSTIRLNAGDIILVAGRVEDVRALVNDPDVVLLGGSTDTLPRREKAPLAIAILVAILLPPALGILPVVATSMAGVIALIATGCLNLRQAARALDGAVYLTIVAAIGLGAALEVTGGTQLIAQSLVATIGNAGPAVAVSVLFLVVAMLTNVLSNNACAVLFAPIAINLGQQLQSDPMAFALAVVFAANCSFATPFGYQTNLLVVGPGNYKFRDFPQAGLPLTLILWVTFSLTAPFFFNL